MSSKEFKFSQTCIKDLENPNTCMKRFKALWIDKTISIESTEYMDYGKYFEEKAIGAGAIQGDEPTVLPTNKNGTMKASQVRLDDQIEVFRDLFVNEDSPKWLGFRITEVQTYLETEWGRGTLDFVCERDDDDSIYVFDLKVTANASSTFGKFAWGRPETMDFIQQVYYTELYIEENKIEDRSRVKTALVVFDYSSEKRSKMIWLDITNDGVKDMWRRWENARGVKESCDIFGYDPKPSHSECGRCPLACKSRSNPNICTVKVTYNGHEGFSHRN